jgi:hypothetical protein
MLRNKFDRVGPRAGRASLVIDGAIAGVLDIPRTWPTHGTTAGLNCGRDAGAPVTDAYQRPFRFRGRSLRVTIELEGDVAHNPGAAYQAVLRER